MSASAVHVAELRKTFDVPERDSGLRAAMKSLVRRKTREVKAVDAILVSRKWRRLSLADVGRLTVSIAKIRPFIVASDWRPTALIDRLDLKPRIKREQLELFAA